MKSPLSFESALQRAASLCAASEHCAYDICEKLLKWGISRHDADNIIERLVDEEYIDEARFARAYARDKMRYNRWGRIKIDQGLRLQRIDADIRRQALDELPEDEYHAVLVRLLENKARTVAARNAYERNVKLFRFAFSHGFEADLIHDCLPPEEDADY